MPHEYLDASGVSGRLPLPVGMDGLGGVPKRDPRFDARVGSRGIPRTWVEDFWVRVDKSGSCWFWKGGTKSSPHPNRDYGRMWWKTGREEMAHRLAWELSVGPIPIRLQVLHRCDIPSCVNPAHLFLGTPTDNMRDAANKGRLRGACYRPRPTHCPQGHPYDARNTRLYKQPSGYFSRYCRQCQRKYTRAWKRKNRARLRRSRTARAFRPAGTTTPSGLAVS